MAGRKSTCGQRSGNWAAAPAQTRGNRSDYAPKTHAILRHMRLNFLSVVPMAGEMPDIVVAHVETPTRNSVLGAKGAGEAGLRGRLGLLSMRSMMRCGLWVHRCGRSRSRRRRYCGGWEGFELRRVVKIAIIHPSRKHHVHFTEQQQ